jgi:hypothetical protein
MTKRGRFGDVEMAARAGRRPKSILGEKAAGFSTRLAPELREAMEKEASKTGMSLSQVLDKRLRESFEIYNSLQGRRNDHNEVFGDIIKLIARKIEQSTERKWNEDLYTFQAFRSGVEALFNLIEQDGNPDIPDSVRKDAESVEYITDASILDGLPTETKNAILEAAELKKRDIVKSKNWGEFLTKELLKELAEGKIALLKGDQTELDFMRQTWIDPKETRKRK